jgi:hypothetical protein
MRQVSCAGFESGQKNIHNDDRKRSAVNIQVGYERSRSAGTDAGNSSSHHNNEEVAVVVREELRIQNSDFYQEGIFTFVPNLDKCVSVLGDYAEKLRHSVEYIS